MSDQNGKWERYPVPQCPECESEQVSPEFVVFEGQERELDEYVCQHCEYKAKSDSDRWFKRRMRSVDASETKEDTV